MIACDRIGLNRFGRCSRAPARCVQLLDISVEYVISCCSGFPPGHSETHWPSPRCRLQVRFAEESAHATTTTDRRAIMHCEFGVSGAPRAALSFGCFGCAKLRVVYRNSGHHLPPSLGFCRVKEMATVLRDSASALDTKTENKTALTTAKRRRRRRRRRQVCGAHDSNSQRGS